MVVQYFVGVFFVVNVEGNYQVCQQQYGGQFYCQDVWFKQCNVYFFGVNCCIVDILVVNVQDGVNDNYQQYCGEDGWVNLDFWLQLFVFLFDFGVVQVEYYYYEDEQYYNGFGVNDDFQCIGEVSVQ